MSNLYSIFKALVPDAPLLCGTVAGLRTDGAIVTLPGGAAIFARGSATVGQKVFVRDGVIEGPAPNLPIEEIEV